MELTQERLKELLSYDPLTGVFLWEDRDVAATAYAKAAQELHGAFARVA